MAKTREMEDSMSRLNRIKPQTNFIFNIIFILCAAICIIPVFFVFMISISSEQSIQMNGYRLYRRRFRWNPISFCSRKAE